MKLLLLLLSLGCFFALDAKERFVYVARHCQAGGSGPNVIKPVKGDAGISKLGVQQSRLLGKRLKAFGFKGKIYVSPYYRTVATACYAAAECGVKVYPDARVQERVSKAGGNMKLGGASLETLRKLFPAQIASDAKLPEKWLYTQIEPHENQAHRKRMAKALDEILAENPDSDIMIVSHAGAVGSLYREISQRSGEKLKASTWNCALYRYSVDDKGKFRCVGYDLDFLPRDMITSNHHKITPAQSKVLDKMLSGVDPKYKE